MNTAIQHMVIFCLKHPAGSAEANQFLDGWSAFVDFDSGSEELQGVQSGESEK